ncbi:MAG: CoA-binding protein [Promethearchaeota archaeon]
MASKSAKQRIKQVFSPDSIVLIGASDNPRTFGFQVARSLIHDFKGPVHYVNPTEARVLGYPTFATINEVPPGPHLWIIATPTRNFPETIRLIGKRQPIGILLFFELQSNQFDNARRAISKLSCPVIGPRAAGFYSSSSHFDMIPLPTEVLPRPRDGATGVITDNRDVAYGLLEQVTKYRCGVSLFIDCGESLGITETDMLAFLAQDNTTKVILLGAGQISNLTKFGTAVRKAHRAKKPVIVSLFPQKITKQLGLHRRIGKTVTPLTSPIAKQHNLVITSSWGRAVDLALLCQTQPLPEDTGVVAISNFGAYCVYIASALHDSPMQLAQLTPKTRNALKEHLPPYCRTDNPIGLYTNADEERLDTALRLVISDPNVHNIIISLLPDSPNIDPDYLYVMLRQRLKALKTPKTIISIIPATERDNLLINSLEQLNIPVYSNSHRAVTTLENAYQLNTRLKTKP